ncbi:aminodeoxychorismate synthase component I [Paenibacillus sp. 481]|uniref:aminodeoxychorismate synthase component I n=1 Tax=Paenibacillus sp. 481 TaxID=2835869 RepID=UPI001E3966AA|nr:aminodeoxychorismate synthase component I [Paenibacillus sp. 481]UHA74843.1 aminodeoxychorismate synthase component I [Paenibacillus sp. 481]
MIPKVGDFQVNQHQSTRPFLLFDFHNEQGEPQRNVFSDPLEVIVAHQLSEVRPALRNIQAAVNEGYYAAGYISYEAAPAFDAAYEVNDGSELPLLWFGIFRKPASDMPLPTDQDYRVTSWQPTITNETYNANIANIHEAIARGETYQVNYTMRLRSEFQGEPSALYANMCDAQQAAYSAYLQLGPYSILSASPELFFRKKGRTLITRPMKGTVKRGRWREEDDEQAKWLFQSLKNRAENVMITDLLRNDLSLIAEIGSVNVPRLFDIERYYTLFQMTSTITAEAREDVELEQIFEALFPCGSITGAPKISTMKLIKQLEGVPREVYCGSIGMISPDGDAVFNVAIRTVWIDNETGQAEFGVGGGITWDSTATDEYSEAVTKSLLLTESHPAFELEEVLRLEDGSYPLLAEHLQRLHDSAVYFGFNVSQEQVRQALDQCAAKHCDGVWKVSVHVSKRGVIQIEVERAERVVRSTAPDAVDTTTASTVPDVSIAPTTSDTSIARRATTAPILSTEGTNRIELMTAPTVASSNRYLYHRTTYRVHNLNQLSSSHDIFDVLLINERHEITECTQGNIVIEKNGERLTPAQDSGLLAGVYRNQLLAQGNIRACKLTAADVQAASQIWIINDMQEWITVTLA